ncbi:hypothetical protein [Halorhabdus sp. CUG00001]|uniref:hypothetical protein n=1 Tax=Halorhabdus sp. CUG00001 TaxID=2600297 RepID=UPI00131C0E3B|nr:hypothetical protein [Halorhabdus sp. CUG00001]
MNLADLPIVGTVYESGADDRVYDGLLLAGPVVIVLVVVLETIIEQSTGTELLAELFAIAYIAVFLGYVLYRGGDQLLGDG